MNLYQSILAYDCLSTFDKQKHKLAGAVVKGLLIDMSRKRRSRYDTALVENVKFCKHINKMLANF